MELRTSFYEQLLQLPLFQGTNRSDFMEIVEKVKFSFFKARETQLVARQDTPQQQARIHPKGQCTH